MNKERQWPKNTFSRNRDQSPSRSRRRSSSVDISQNTRGDSRSYSLDRLSKKDKKSSKSSSYDDKKKSKKKHKSRDRDRSKSKKKKHRRRSSSSSEDSSSSDSDSDRSTKLLQRLQNERIQQELDKKKLKDIKKAKETPEEKRERRLAAKLVKERKRKERMGWDNEYMHYTNTDNPFGDGNLTSTFVWSKKLNKDGLKDVSQEELDRRNRYKQLENKVELEKVKKRRQEREMERQQREDEMAMLQRSKEAAQFEEWERQEDRFHLEQARLRSCIRIQDGSAKPIDLLAKYIGAEDEVDAVEMHEPYTYLNGLTAQDFEDLVEDIKVYKELERGRNLDYWNDLTVIVEDELHKLRKMEGQSEYQAALGRREGIHKSVVADVSEVFKGKSASQLADLQKQIETKITGKADGVDIGYWESLLSQLKAHMARARLRDRHQDNLRKKLQLLQAEQNVAVQQTPDKVSDIPLPDDSPASNTEIEPVDVNIPSTSRNAEDVEHSDEDQEDKSSDSEGDGENSDSGRESPATVLLGECFHAYEVGGYSPVYLTPNQLEPGTVVVDEDSDISRLQFSRSKVINRENTDGTKRQGDSFSKEEISLRVEARRGMGGDEAEFSVEAGLDAPIYLWSDKYRPRKPRYFNRVHTGFEWNKYNQTHYDMDNPPPKIVQGYKFNIFYPDLINKSDTPEYYLTPCPDNRDFAVLRFKAGPPYEDIAFKIVSREWEYSYKRGFRCQFHNNVFQLWFHFKRYRYRR